MPKRVDREEGKVRQIKSNQIRSVSDHGRPAYLPFSQGDIWFPLFRVILSGWHVPHS